VTILKWEPGAGDFFGQMQYDNCTLSVNVFGHLANGGEGAQLAQWNVPIDGGPVEVFNRSNCLSGPLETDGQGNPLPIKMSFSGTYDPNNLFTIRQFTNFILGSNAGYYQTWGRSCNAPSEAYDMTPATNEIGYPCLLGDIPQTTVHVEYTETGDSGGCYNIFGDVYLHDVSDDSLLPTNNANGGAPQTQYRNTVNGISQNDTKMWNPNFWFNLPICFNSHDNVAGDLITTNLEVESGRQFDVYANRLGFSGNNCVFLNIVFTNISNSFQMDITAYIDWMKSTAMGPGTFLTEIYDSSVIQGIAAEMANPPSVGGVTPLARTLRPPDDLMAMDGYQQGSEVWGVNPSGNVTEISYSQLGFTVDGEVYGLVTDSTSGGGGTVGGSGGGTAVTIVPKVPTTDAEFTAWRADRKNDPYRLFLAELDHSGGIVRLGSDPWLSDTHDPYDDAIEDTPLLQYSAENVVTVGDIKAVNLDAETVDWLSFDWYGYRSRWYFGDIRWTKSDFRTIATATIRRCRYISASTYQFDLVSDSEKYNHPFLTEKTSFTGDASTVLTNIFAAANSIAGQEVGFFEVIGNVPLDVELEVSEDENTSLDDVIKKLCVSLNARRRISQGGALQIVSREQVTNPQFEFYEDVIDEGSLRVVNTRNPAATVAIKYASGIETEIVPTGASINGLGTQATIDTYLKNRIDAFNLGNIEAGRHRQAVRVWEADVLGNLEQNNVADQGSVEHPALTGFGEITRVQRTPLDDITRIEVEI